MISRLCVFLVGAVSLLFYAAAVPQEPPPPAKDKPAETPKKPAAKKKGLPLKSERTIEFTTDEGSWISLDVSPDGKTVVFELLGDLYTIPIEGGEAKLIAGGMAFDSLPRYSPDGKMIAFLSDREGSDNVWISKADGTDPKQLSRDQQSRFLSPSWAPDGDYVLVSRSQQGFGAYELWMYHIKGGSGVQVTRNRTPTTQPNQGHGAAGGVASPDGKYFYYARRIGVAIPYNALLPMWQIARRDRLTGEEDVLTQSAGSAMRPVLSPDGKYVVYGTRYEAETGLRIRELATGEDRWLKYPVQRDDQESVYSRDLLPGYAFLPDGKQIVVSYGGKIYRVDVANGEARGVPFTAKVSQQIGPLLNFPQRIDEGPVRARLIQAPAQSPDGKRLAFSALTHLYTVELPGGAPARVTSGDAREFMPAWSPDGQWLAYVTWAQEGGHIFKIRADGKSAPQQLTRLPAFYNGPTWTPDGTQIVTLRAPRQQRVEATGMPSVDLIVLPAEGGDASVILPARGAGQPHFSNEKDRVYLHTFQGLVSVRFDGTDRRTHVRIVGRSQGPEPAPAQNSRISPDGRYALALYTNQLYVVTIPKVGGEAPTVNVSSASTPVKKLTDVGADYFAWADSGKTITWALGSTFFRVPFESVSFEAPQRPEGAGEAAAGEGATPAAGAAVQAEEIEIAIERPRHRPKGDIVLRGATVITIRGDEVIPNADIVVQDNRITAVGRSGAFSVPPGAKIFDVKGTTIMPGIVDVHAHYFGVQRGILDMQNWTFLANLAYGVTTGRDPQTGSNDMFAYQDLVEAGEMIGPRAFSTGPGVFAATDFQSLDEARKVVAKYKKHYRTHTLKSYLVGNRRQRQWMIEACKEHGIMPTTEGGLDLKLDLTHLIDGFSGNEHSLPIVPLYKDVVEVFARAGIFYTPTLLVAYGGPFAENYFYETTEVHDDPKLRRFIPHSELDDKSRRRPWFRKEEHVFPRTAASAAKIIRAGGRVCVGGHGQLQGIQCHWEMWALQSGGLTNMEVLRAATLHGAEAIGYAADLGSIEVGKLADLIVLAKNPLDDIRNTNTIKYVMKDGELFEGDTLNQLWPRERKLPPLWWWDDKP